MKYSILDEADALTPGIFFGRCIISIYIDQFARGQMTGIIVNDKTLIGKPGEIMYIVLPEMKNFYVRRRWRERVIDRFITSTFSFYSFPDGFPFKCRPGFQPFFFFRILQFACSRYHIIFWHGNTDIKASKLTV